MKRVSSILTAAVGLVALAGACADSRLPTENATTTTRELTPFLSKSGDRAEGFFDRYVAIGTSLTMGVQSDGVASWSQKQSWVAQLAAMGGHKLSLPLISGYGCGSQLTWPLVKFRRTRPGEEAFTPFDGRECDPRVGGEDVPVANLAVDGARTDEAIGRKAPPTPTLLRDRQYQRVLGQGHHQISAMLAQQPNFVSVELGGNDILGARNGFYREGVTVLPMALWQRAYLGVLEAVRQTGGRAILIGLLDDAMEFPALRTGAEIASQARAFKSAFNVDVDPRCGEEHARNVLFVPIRVVAVVAKAVQSGSATLSCADLPAPAVDYVLSPQDIALVNEHLARMNAFIRQEATDRGYAYAELESIYGRPFAKPPFNIVALMKSPFPYGPYISLDGIHPNGRGARLLAIAAAKAIEQKYGVRIRRSDGRGDHDDDHDDDH